MNLPKQVLLPLRASAFLHICSSIFADNFGALPLSNSRSTILKLSEVGALVYLSRKCLRLFTSFGRKKLLEVLGLLFFVPHFALGRQIQRQSVARHFLELVVLSRLGLRTPPVNAFHKSLRSLLKFGPWQRHKIELQSSKEIGDTYCHLAPFVKLSEYSYGSMLCFTSNHDVVKQVMTDKETFPSRSPKDFIVDTKEGMLLYDTGPKWALHRKIVTQFLTEKNLAHFADSHIGDQINIMTRKWDEGSGEVEVHHDLSLLTYEVITRFVTGIDINQTQNQRVAKEDFEVSKTVDYVVRWGPLLAAFPEWLPIPMKYRLRNLLQTSDAKIVASIQKALESQNPGDPPTMLSTMKNARLENGDFAMSPHDLLEEVATMFGAGHETTSNTLCWTMILLAKNPEKFRILQEEVDRVVCNDTATYEEAKSLKYATMVIYEALRIYPTVPSFPRTSVKDTVLGGYDIPAGSVVFVSQAPLNMDPERWENPESFCPERFHELPELKMSKPVGVPGGESYGYVPFGAGQRTCVGQRFALMESVQILGSIVKTHTWTLADGSPIHEVSDVTLGPKYGLNINVRRRTQPDTSI